MSKRLPAGPRWPQDDPHWRSLPVSERLSPERLADLRATARQGEWIYGDALEVLAYIDAQQAEIDKLAHLARELASYLPNTIPPKPVTIGEGWYKRRDDLLAGAMRMIFATFPPAGAPRANGKPCLCGCPRGRHLGTKHAGRCGDTRCSCPKYQQAAA